MKTIQINIYSFDELTTEAKEKALEIYRHFNVDDSFWYNCVFEDFISICETIGITIDKKEIHFSGFWSLGDGSTFGATVNILQFIKGIETQAWKSHAPNVELHIKPFSIDSRIKALLANGTIDNSCTVSNPIRGNWTNVDTSFDYSCNKCKDYLQIDRHLDLLEQWIDKSIERLNKYLYKLLEEDYEYQTSDEAVTQSILSNNFQFMIDGKEAQRLLNIEAAIEA